MKIKTLLLAGFLICLVFVGLFLVCFYDEVDGFLDDHAVFDVHADVWIFEIFDGFWRFFVNVAELGDFGVYHFVFDGDFLVTGKKLEHE